MAKHQTYKIKEGDTIESIAKARGLDVEELKDYHNNRAHLNDRILFSLPDHLEEVIVPPEGFILKNGKEVWVGEGDSIPFSLSYNRKLYRKPYKGDLTYGVLKTIRTGETEQTIKYKINARFYPKNRKNNEHVSIDVISNTYINNQEPDLIADEMALACTKVLYPLVLRIDNGGLPVTIENHRAILKRWEKQKAINLGYYKGEVAEKYFQLFEQTLSNRELLFHYLQNDWLFPTFFNDLYTTYNDNYEQERKVYLSVIPHTMPVEYKINQKVSRYLINNHIKIVFRGECTDLRSKTDLENALYFPSDFSNKEPTVKGNYRALYFLNPKTYKIEAAYLECGLSLSKEKKVSISISEITDAPEPGPENIRHLDFVVEEKEKKTSFLKMLFS